MHLTKNNKDRKFVVKSHRDSGPSCKYCGGLHQKGAQYCPAYGQTCRKCSMRNHFQGVCQRAQPQRRTIHQVRELNFDTEEADILWCTEHVRAMNEKGEMFFVNLKIENTMIKCQIDTGASCNVLSYRDFCVIMESGNPPMQSTNSKLRLYDGTIISSLGECQLACCHDKKGAIPLQFKIVPGNQRPLLSGKTCVTLGLVTIHVANNIQLDSSSEALISEFQDVFEGLGCLEGEYSIEVDPNVSPVQHAPRRVPVALKEMVLDKLKELELKGIITKVTEPTDWISSMVAVLKPGKLRICLDPRDLNKAILRPKYPIPTLEDVLPLLAKARVFSVLDAKDGFHQVRLDEKSSFLTTFWTPFGRFRYLRMPFGISSAPEEWQRRVHENFGDLRGVTGITDDLLVFGCGDTDEEAVIDHDINLRAALLRARERNVKLNRKKLRLRLPEVSYMGQLITKEGLRPDPLKVQAIKDMPTPDCKKAVQRLLGSVNYLSRFLPNLAKVSEPLRLLTEKSTIFTWQSSQQQAFMEICRLLSEAPVLKYYDLQEEVTVQCDASEKGLGAVLMQMGQPIAFASKALSETEQNYAQIEKECLAILFGCKRFDQYLHGREEITIESDHKPLIPIFNKPLHSAPKRLQRMMLSLQKYKIKVCYKPGKDLHLADMLSRAYPSISDTTVKKSSPWKLDAEIFHVDEEAILFAEVEQMNPTDYISASKKGMHRVRKMTASDPVFIDLQQIVLSGWPAQKEKVQKHLRQFWPFRDEIVTHNGLLFKGQQIIIPHAMRSQMIQRIHSSHLGPEACVRRAKDVIFWPGMSAEIKDKISSCSTCNAFRSRQPKEPLIPYQIPDRQWQIVGQDIFTFDNWNYLITVDYYSDFWEVDRLRSTCSDAVVEHTKSHFARHGIPDLVVTDNGPNFVSSVYETFAKAWGFEHRTSSPYHSQGNGKSESAVKIAKSLLKKATHDRQDYQLAVLAWRNTPQRDDGSSPCQKLMSRRTNTLLPTTQSLLRPVIVEGVSATISNRKQAAKKYYDKRTHTLPELKLGQTVRMQPVNNQKIWRKAVCEEKCAPRSYIVKTENGATYRRNRKYLRESNEKFVPIEEWPQAVGQQGTARGIARNSVQCDIPQRPILQRERKMPVRFKDYYMY